ncbi:PH domain-containing protein [Candidatus Soleaferrea massiliensis]|uniref:PH domain-containing protein n=1 Tax=Candidatus Soleaferrea massiliensis TaxID=1470354 RepID=UPI00058E13F2|nr:PH domain-containing protein [Candidatus Soleaferrea massiliensis]
MIDFENGSVFKLKQVKNDTFDKQIVPLMVKGEMVISVYQTVRDGIVFTNKRIIVINVQGMTGKKKSFTSLPYRKVQVFAIETSGVFDMDSELELYFSGLGKVKFELTGGSNVSEICRVIGEYVL